MVVSYRLYKGGNTLYECLSRETSNIKDFVKQMKIPIHRRHSSCEDSSRVLDFLASYIRKPNIQKMSWVAAFWTLLSFLDGFALIHYEAMIDTKLMREEKIMGWLDAMQYSLDDYAPAKDATKAVHSFQGTKQSLEKNEKDFYRRRNEGFNCCGNAFP